MSEKKESLKDVLKAALSEHIATIMEDFPYWTAEFRLDEWDYEDETDQAKALALFNALYEILLETQPNIVEIKLHYAVDISDLKKGEKEKREDENYYL